MTKTRDFDEWLSRFRASISVHTYYVDFEKVYSDVEGIRFELSILNSLIASKLNETARSHKTLATESDTIPNFTFIWFTDGAGWKNARNNLEETFDTMEHIYSIDDMENGIVQKLFGD
jgi:hypothetical protein